MWQKIGKNAFQAKHPEGGFVHALKLGKDFWSVTHDGRVVARSAKDEADAKSLAEAYIADEGATK